MLGEDLGRGRQGVGDIIVVYGLATSSTWGCDDQVADGDAMEMSQLAVLEKSVSLLVDAEVSIDNTEAYSHGRSLREIGGSCAEPMMEAETERQLCADGHNGWMDGAQW